ncbi:MAG: WD40 repeat domain-containing protein, partial [Candidatus Sigynarchaeota archaeon]
LDIPRQAAVTAIVHLPGTTRVAAALSDGEIRVIDIATGDLVATWRGHDGGVNDLALVPGRGLVVSGGEDGTIVAWDVETSAAVRRFAGHSSPVKKIAASPRGDLVAAGLENGTTWIWSIETGERLHVLDNYEERVTTLAFFPDGERLVSAGLEGMMRFWHARSGIQLGEVEYYDTFPYGVVFTDDDKYILACFNDVDIVPRNPIAVIDATSYEHVCNIFQDNPHAIDYPVLRLGSSPREHLLAGISGYWIRVYALEEEMEIRSFRCRNVPNSLAFIPGTPWLVSGDEGGDLVVWDLESKDPATVPAKENDTSQKAPDPDTDT